MKKYNFEKITNHYNTYNNILHRENIQHITVHVRTDTNDIICIVSGTVEKLFRVIGTCGQFPALRNR